MSTRQRIWAGITLALLLLLGAGWYWGSPRYSLSQMKAAAEAGDTERLATYIDFPALRGSLKDELKAQLLQHAAVETEGLGAFGAMMATAMVDQMIEGMVTPAGMRKMFVKDKSTGPEGMTKVDATSPDMEIDRVNFDEFRLRAKNRPVGGGQLIFKRSGLGWQLTGMQLPDLQKPAN